MFFSSLSSYEADGSSICRITDPARYAGRSLPDQDKLQLLISSMNLPRQYKFPVTGGRKLNPNWLLTKHWLCYSVKNDSLYCISCFCFGSALALDFGKISAEKET